MTPKIVQSYVPVNFDLQKPYTQIIWKEILYTQLLSVLMIKKIYGKISFYTNETIAKQIVDIGIPYDEINTSILSNIETKTFSVLKLKVFESINEPFIHIDTDTIIYKNINLNLEKNYLFGYKDFPDLNETTTPSGFNNYVKNALKSYAFLFNQLENTHPESIRKNFDVSTIPNMNFIYVKDHDTFRKAVQSSLQHYETYKHIIDETETGPCYVEQLMIHLNLMDLDNEYAKSVKEKEIYLCDKWFLQILQERENIPFSKKDFNYPLTFKNHFDKNLICDCCGNPHPQKNEHTIKNNEDIINFFNHDFGGITHFSYYKWSPIFQALIIGQIAHVFGVDWLYKVNEYFKNIYLEHDLKLPILSEGEKLYEKVSGFRFYNRTFV